MCWLYWVGGMDGIGGLINRRLILGRVVVSVLYAGCCRANYSCVDVDFEVGRRLRRLVGCGMML